MVKTKEEEGNLVLNNDLVKAIYKHVDMLADSKYKIPIETLKQRHKSYEAEDFVQDTVKLILDAFKTKTFATFSKLKGFINLTMEYHYLKEKRKYFQTQSRGSAICMSFEDPADSIRSIGETIGDTVEYGKSYENDLFDLYNIYSKNLYVFFNWEKPVVGTLKELKHFKKGFFISVNHFIKYQKDNGADETCRFYKENKFYMTKNTFEIISQAIIDYAKEHELIIVEPEKKKYVFNRHTRFEQEVEQAIEKAQPTYESPCITYNIKDLENKLSLVKEHTLI